jgi:hypothetical protein
MAAMSQKQSYLKCHHRSGVPIWNTGINTHTHSFPNNEMFHPITVGWFIAINEPFAYSKILSIHKEPVSFDRLFVPNLIFCLFVLTYLFFYHHHWFISRFLVEKFQPCCHDLSIESRLAFIFIHIGLQYTF